MTSIKCVNMHCVIKALYTVQYAEWDVVLDSSGIHNLLF